MLRLLGSSLCAVPPARLRRAHARATCAVRVSASTYLAELRIKVSSEGAQRMQALAHALRVPRTLRWLTTSP